ncbi:MAG: Hsp20/alpha crystallin family protein [Ignavibacteriaceae bacterium]|nr:Hsp20/alpha crystallin family protein [Ignavibacteriaceae bacterium]
MRFINFEPLKLESVNNLKWFNDGFKSLIDEMSTINFENKSNFIPKFDISEDKSKLYFETEVPGMNKADIKISVQNDVLTISGEKKRSEEVKEKNYFRSERTFGSFKRSFTLPSDIDAENIQAKFENGVLSVAIPKVSIDRNIEKMIEIK